MTKQMKKPAFAQTFSLAAPGASSVVLVGEFTPWEGQTIKLRQQSEGMWQGEVEMELELKPGEYRYRFLVDGEWHEEPEFVVRVPNPFAVVKATERAARQ